MNSKKFFRLTAFICIIFAFIIGVSPSYAVTTAQPFSSDEVAVLESQETQSPDLSDVTCGSTAGKVVLWVCLGLALALAIGSLASSASETD